MGPPRPMLLLALIGVLCAGGLGQGVLGVDALVPRDRPIEFAYADYSAVLGMYVRSSSGWTWVDYEALKADRGELDAFVDALADLPAAEYRQWTREKQLALWLNAYNALTLKVIVDHYPIAPRLITDPIAPRSSIRQIPGVWSLIAFDVAGRRVTLGDIENAILRSEFADPRVHMAMNCGAVSAPPLRMEPYTGAQIEEQLDDQTRVFLSRPDVLWVDGDSAWIFVSQVFEWFAEDFAERVPVDPAGPFSVYPGEKAAVLTFLSRYGEPGLLARAEERRARLAYRRYDWSLNASAAETEGDDPLRP